MYKNININYVFIIQYIIHIYNIILSGTNRITRVQIELIG